MAKEVKTETLNVNPFKRKTQTMDIDLPNDFKNVALVASKNVEPKKTIDPTKAKESPVDLKERPGELVEEPKASLPSVPKPNKPKSPKKQTLSEASSEDTWMVQSIYVDEAIFNEFRFVLYEKVRESLQLTTGEDSLTYFFHLMLKNVKRFYEAEYGELLKPGAADVSLYSKKNIKGVPLPSWVELDKDKPKSIMVRIRKADSDLLYELMHTYYLNHKSEYNGVRFSKTVFFIIMIQLVQKKIKSLKK